MPEQSTLSAPEPQDSLAESAVLAAAMIEPELCWAKVATLSPDVFRSSAHRAWFEAIRALPHPDPITVHAWLADHGLAGACDLDYILRAMSATPGVGNLDHHIRIIEDRSLQRKLLNAARSAQELVESGELSASDAAAKIATDFIALTTAGAREELVSLADMALQVIEDAERAHNTRQAIGVPTGIPALDILTGGLQPGDLIIIAARPSEGKTALLIQIMVFAAKITHMIGLMISREMSAASIVRRLMTAIADLEQFRLRSGQMSDAEWDRLTHAMSQLSPVPLMISDAPRQTLASIRAKALALKVEGKLGLVGVDYLQLIDEPRIKGESRAEQVARISGGLKALARELNVPVVVLSQLRRSVDGQKGRPELDDLRESGAIEQDADVVLMIHTPDKEQKHQDKRPVELILAKQRNGPTGKVNLMFDRARGQFKPIDARHDNPPPEPRRRNGD